jgi:hypothetical protein
MLIATSANVTEPNHIFCGTVEKAYRITNCGPNPVLVEWLFDAKGDWEDLDAEQQEEPFAGSSIGLNVDKAIDVAYCQIRVRSVAANQVSRVWVEII